MIEVPILLKITNLEDFDIFNINGDYTEASIMVGPYFGYTLGTFAKSGSDREKLEWDELNLKRRHWGLVFAAGGEGVINDQHRVGIHIAYKLGLSDFDLDEGFNQYFRSSEISLVYYPTFNK